MTLFLPPLPFLPSVIFLAGVLVPLPSVWCMPIQFAISPRDKAFSSKSGFSETN